MQDENLSPEQSSDAMPRSSAEMAQASALPVTEREPDAPLAAKPRPSLNALMQRYWWVLLLAIIFVGGVFRFTGVNWDDEQHLHPDERFMTMVSSAIRLPDSIGEYFDTDK